jgi:hypothetical protein
MSSNPPRPVRIALDDAVRAWDPEVQYVFRTLLRIAGFPCEFVAVRDEDRPVTADIYYGPPGRRVRAGLTIAASLRPFAHLEDVEPERLRSEEGLDFLEFGDDRARVEHREGGTVSFTSDLVFASYWFLTGARERTYPRDQWDNLSLEGSFLLEHGLVAKPIVSLYATYLRRWLIRKGLEPMPLPWGASDRCAFVFSHDVDYPEMIRWLECLRLLRGRGTRAFSSIAGVLAGTNHFWKFAEWVSFEAGLGARPAFYFMARQGSLLQYARGTPDAFYDIRSRRFRTAFRSLADQGCEIGLHASFHAHESDERFRAEKEALEEASGGTVAGNRHHYWHLNPDSPNDTLRNHERAGFQYDTSLVFEFYPGFRRGICHPFYPFHPAERRELDLVELPPTWMDDHFDRRLAHNHIEDPAAYARELLRTTARTGGVAVVDYHVRGMNGDFYPRYGLWLMRFLRDYPADSLEFHRPLDICQRFVEYDRRLRSHSTSVEGSTCYARA